MDYEDGTSTKHPATPTPTSNQSVSLDEIMAKIKARYQDVPARLLIHTDGSGHIEVEEEPDEVGNTWLPYFIFAEIDELISHINEERR